ncbi:MAG: hypothetical protein AAGC65_12460 [Mucilaginibacter sp.]|uniref:hypothetical protein n=1 Tax=Mucilaginibacter sp. TaxID=1882438 RepID=UPI0031B1E025
MKQQQTMNPILSPYNKSVSMAYALILKQAKQLLSTLEREELRFSLEREEKSAPIVGTIIHEIINPILYLRLECHSTNSFAIHYGFEEVLAFNQYSKITSTFVRNIYRLTSKDLTETNIEDCVRTDWCINTCSEMYEYIEQSNKYHTFKQIRYKPATARRKQMHAVA